MRCLLFVLFFLASCYQNRKPIEDDTAEVELYDEDTARACHTAIEEWRFSWVDLEFRVLDEVNAVRSEPANCGTYGDFEATLPLEMEPHIHCSSRYHSYWMAENNAFAHESPGGDLGEDTFARMERTGFQGMPTGENVAMGYPTPSEVIAGWMSSDGHCSNMMSPSHNVIGIGFYQHSDGMYYWTQNFGLLIEEEE